MGNKRYKRPPWCEGEKKLLKKAEEEYLRCIENFGRDEAAIAMEKKIKILKKWDELSDKGASLDGLSEKDYRIFGIARRWLNN